MARLAGFPEDTFVAMSHIRDAALVGFGSLFTPERTLWGSQNQKRFHALFVERFDEGEGSFLEKFRKQLDGADDDVYQLAGEMLYVQQFFTSLTGPEKKIENVQAVLGWCAHPVQVPEWAISGVKRGLAGDQSFNQHRPFHLAWLNEFLIHWHETPSEKRSDLLKDPWLFAQDVRGVEFSGGAYQPMREAWLYIIFPEHFENISSRRDKRLIREAFKDRLERGTTDNIDADLLAIRKSLDSQEGEGFHFYRSPFIEQWQTDRKKTKSADGGTVTKFKGEMPPASPPHQPGSAFLVDMNAVFERFLRTALREALGVDPSSFPERPPRTSLDVAGVVPLKPDLCLLDRRAIVWVGDAKYKRLPMGGYRNADLYQLLAYSIALNLPGGTLVYAADEGVTAAEHTVVESGKQLRVVALDLTAPRSNILLQIRSLAVSIRPRRAEPEVNSQRRGMA